jgi:L-cysteine desulfidase
MTKEMLDQYARILKEELVPAMGCTEPIAVAYAAALARETLGEPPRQVQVLVSPNILKNVKSVVVPHTQGLRGIAAAAATGIAAGRAGRKLEVISEATEEDIARVRRYLDRVPIAVGCSQREWLLNIQVTVRAGEHSAFVEIAGSHTHVIRVERDGEALAAEDYEEAGPEPTACSGLTVEGIVDFAGQVDLDLVAPTLERQIALNTAVAQEGLTGRWGAGIGRILLDAYGDQVHNRAKAMAAAGSDSRMSGCELPVVINSGSGNQGLTASLPVIVYAEDMGASRQELLRALVVSNLVTIHLKEGIGKLSAYCGATSAGCGAAAGVCYLMGGRLSEIAHTIVNGVAINSGMICDGAKPSCAAKIASAVEAGLLGLQMQRHNAQFFGGEGIVTKGVEATILNVCSLARNGMASTDKEIIRMMTCEGC